MPPLPAPSTNNATRPVLPWLLALLLLLIAPLSLATTSVDNAGNADGTVTDPTTGLVWMRCAMGMTWTGSTCSGEARTYTFSQANALTGAVTFAGQNDWRLPNIRELQTIVYWTANNPAIDSAAFPNTPSTIFWSNSLGAEGSRWVWGVDFDYGGFVGWSDWGDNAVRLVRGGQSFSSLLSITRPTGDYVDHGDGTVTHTPTNLTWKRCAQGQVWDDSGCSGTPTVHSVSQANALTGTTVFAGKNDWRLPTIEELLSLVDYSTDHPGINTSIFPGVTLDHRYYLSSSRIVENLRAVQFVDFYNGRFYLEETSHGSVLLVRGEPSSVPKCTLRADPSPILAGASTTLTAYCSPAVTSYTWTGGTCVGTTAATCTVTPTSMTTYTVAGTNVLGTGAAASTTVKVSDSSMQVNADGTVTDPETGLTWMRCAMGQTWTGITCSGKVNTYTFDQANALTGTVTFAGRSDWRLPNIRELQTIVDWTTYQPTIDSAVFPNTLFVSWNGYAYSGGYGGAVRLVRGGQSFSTLLDIARPTYDYIDNGDGTVTHKATRLTWKRCVEGHTWNADSTCSGNAAVMKLDQAKEAASSHVFAGYNDWRLPTIEELLSLVDYSASKPAINTSVFPQTSNCCEPNFWTNSPYPSEPGSVWVVYFWGYGSPINVGRRYDIGWTRLVRGGQPSGALLTPVCTLNASPVVVAAGASATLTANCTPTATSYVWTNSGLDAGMGSGKVSPAQTTRYSVKGVNAAGTGDAASAAVYVCNTTPGDNYPGITFSGTPAADVVANTLGADFMDGSAGIDTVIYQCNRSSFTVTRTAEGWAVVSSKAEGEDTLSNVERLHFGDETLALDISGNAGQAYRLYQAAFNRTPDNGGLKYWIGQLDAGMSLQDVAARFIDSDEFRQLYGTNPNNANFLTRLYNNVLHRAPDTGGYAWWLNQLNIGAHSQTTALMGFSESPENQAGVLNAIINGIDLLN